MVDPQVESCTLPFSYYNGYKHYIDYIPINAKFNLLIKNKVAQFICRFCKGLIRMRNNASVITSSIVSAVSCLPDLMVE